MEKKVIIYGKDTCPYTQAALADYEKKGVDVTYLNVEKDKEALESMLKYSGGDRNVPVIVEKGKVTVGFGGT